MHNRTYQRRRKEDEIFCFRPSGSLSRAETGDERADGRTDEPRYFFPPTVEAAYKAYQQVEEEERERGEDRDRTYVAISLSLFAREKESGERTCSSSSSRRRWRRRRPRPRRRRAPGEQAATYAEQYGQTDFPCDRPSEEKVMTMMTNFSKALFSYMLHYCLLPSFFRLPPSRA